MQVPEGINDMNPQRLCLLLENTADRIRCVSFGSFPAGVKNQKTRGESGEKSMVKALRWFGS